MGRHGVQGMNHAIIPCSMVRVVFFHALAGMIEQIPVGRPADDDKKPGMLQETSGNVKQLAG
jgi:hypothetical protein